MKRLTLQLAVMLVLAAPCIAAQTEAPPTREHYFPEDYRPAPQPPADGSIIKYAEDGEEGPQRNFGVQIVHDNQLFATFKADRFEHQWREDEVRIFLWDVKGWIGRDFNKLYLKSEGEARLDGNNDIEGASVDLLYSRTISTFWDLQLGLRHDFEPQPSRSFAALGLMGMAPYRFEVDATAYLSEDGDLSALIEAEYELMLTQRLVVVPRLEAGLSLQDVPGYGQWQGVTDLTLGARLLYQLRREFAPYLGVTWTRQLGETANRIENSGGDIESAGLVAGIRFWF